MRTRKLAAAGVAGAASMALTLGAAGTAGAVGSMDSGSLGSADPGTACGTTVVSPNNHGTWSTPPDETPPGFAAVEGAPLGDGALTLGNSDQGTSFYRTVGMPLGDLAQESGGLMDISYQYTAANEDNPSATGTPALQLRVTGASTADGGNGFATIVWSPEASDGAWAQAEPGDSDQYWVTRDIVDENDQVVLKKGERTTLSHIIELNPDATLDQIGVQQTKDNQSTDVAVDGFTFGCEVTDFEPGGGPGGSLDGVLGSLNSLSG